MRKRTALATVATAAAALLLLAGCAPSASSETSDASDVAPSAEATIGAGGEFDITELCGEEPVKIALLDGAGGHTWRNIQKKVFEEEAAKCPNIETGYADAGGDAQKQNANIEGFIAQGYDVLIDIADFGDAEIPALREAYQAGLVVVPFYNTLTGTPGSDYTTNVTVNTEGYGEQMGEWVLENAEPGNVIVLGGPATCTSCQALYDGVATALEGTDFTVLGDGVVTATDYDPGKAQQAVAGLLSKFGDVTALVGDYGVVADAAMKAFKDAGAPMPVLATSSGQNSQYCSWSAAQEAGEGYEFAGWEGGTQVVKTALRVGLAEFNGIADDEPTDITFEKLVDTAAGVNPPECRSDLPDDADMFSGLTDAQIEEAIAGK